LNALYIEYGIIKMGRQSAQKWT